MNNTEIKRLRELVKNNYEEIATDFDLTRKNNLWPLAQLAAEKVNPGQKVLDLGCGNGRLKSAFKNKEIVYLGIDNSTTLLEIAKKNYPESKFLLGDILLLEEVISQNDKFDYIFCLATLQHIPSQELRINFLKKLKNYLLPGGEIIISNWNLWSSKHRKLIFKFAWQKILGKNKLDFKDIIFSWQLNGKEKSDRYYHAFTSFELKKIARQAGYKKIILKKDKYNFWLYLQN